VKGLLWARLLMKQVIGMANGRLSSELDLPMVEKLYGNAVVIVVRFTM